MRRRDKDTQGLADLEYLVEGGIRGAPTELTPGPEMYVPVVDELQSAMDAKESGASALAELKEGNLGAAGLDGLMAMLAAAGAVPAVGTPARAIHRVIRKAPLENKKSIFFTEPAHVPEAPIKIASKTKDKDNYLLDEDGDPIIVYHSTKEIKPIEELKTSKQRKEEGVFDFQSTGQDFMSTSLSPETAQTFGLASRYGHGGHGGNYFEADKKISPKDLEDEVYAKSRGIGARLIPGMVKANKIFDYQNKKHIKELEKILDKTEKKMIKDIEKMDFKNKRDLKNLKRIIKTNRKQLREGNFNIIEDPRVQEVIKELGYTSFTTYERGAKNIMLFNPKDFVPLFDQKKTSTLGYKKGGAIIERNPYNYTAKAI